MYFLWHDYSVTRNFNVNFGIAGLHCDIERVKRAHSLSYSCMIAGTAGQAKWHGDCCHFLSPPAPPMLTIPVNIWAITFTCIGTLLGYGQTLTNVGPSCVEWTAANSLDSRITIIQFFTAQKFLNFDASRTAFHTYSHNFMAHIINTLWLRCTKNSLSAVTT